MLATRLHQLAVLASGDVSDFEALALVSQPGDHGGPVVLLLCDNPHARTLVRAGGLVPAAGGTEVARG